MLQGRSHLQTYHRRCEIACSIGDNITNVKKEYRAILCVNQTGSMDLGNFSYAVNDEMYIFNASYLYSTVIVSRIA